MNDFSETAGGTINGEGTETASHTLEMLESILNTMDAYIHVTDMDTDEMLFINQKMLLDFNLPRNYKGYLCWQVFQMQEGKHCSDCLKTLLIKNPNEPIVWEESNSFPGKALHNITRIIDWPDGRKVHMQQSVDISRLKQIQEALEYRSQMLDTLNKTAIMFLSQNEMNYVDTMTVGVGLIVDITALDRLSVFKNSIASDGLHTSQVYRWDRISGGTTAHLEGLNDFSYARLIPHWEEILAAGEHINGPASELPDSAVLKSYNCVSLYATPVFMENTFWGFVLFEDLQKERVFSGMEVEILRSASLMMANTVEVHEKTVKVREAEELTKLMLDSSPLFCQIWNRRIEMIDCNEAGVKLFGLKDKQELIDKFLSLSPEFQPNAQRSADLVQIYVQKAFDDGAFAFDWMHQLLDGTLIPSAINLVRVPYGDDFLVVGHIRDLRNIREMEQNIRYLESEVDKAYYDALTGIPNRRSFDLNLKHTIKSLSRTNSVLSVLMIDIDNFKRFNDSYGHSEGDACLQKIAGALAASIHREEDFIARYGGEEFVAVLPNTDERGAQVIAERMLRAVFECHIPHAHNDAAPYVTISIGATTGSVHYVQSGEEFIKKADEMLYISKNSGRNRYRFEKM